MGPDDFAFPIPELNWSNGMTLRDYFAAKAMAAFITWEETGGHAIDHQVIADYAYSMADAMLRAREA